MWSKKYSECQNCGTQKQKYYHKSRGYCYRCYPLILEREKVEQWKYNDPGPWKELYKIYFHNIQEKDFNREKSDKLKIIKCKLDWYKNREEILKGEITGKLIASGLQHIAIICGVRNKNLFSDWINTFDWNFMPEQKKLIFECIDKIEQNLPWRMIDNVNCLENNKE